VYSHHDDGGEDDVALGASSLMELGIGSVVFVLLACLLLKNRIYVRHK
jgi:hypothetical protein